MRNTSPASDTQACKAQPPCKPPEGTGCRPPAPPRKQEVDYTVPVISVRQPWTSQCGSTCGGRSHGRPPKSKPCGPSPIDSQATTQMSTPACGLPSCFEEEVCPCRCPCALRLEMKRRELEPQSPTSTPQDIFPPRNMAQVHLARIYALEPRGPSVQYVRWPRHHVWRMEKRHFQCRPPRYAHAVLENALPGPPCCRRSSCFFVHPNGVRDF